MPSSKRVSFSTITTIIEMPYCSEAVEARMGFDYARHGDSTNQGSPQERLLKTQLKSIREDRMILGIQKEALHRQTGSVLQQRQEHLRESGTDLTVDKQFEFLGEQVQSLRKQVLCLEERFDASLERTFELFDELCAIRTK